MECKKELRKLFETLPEIDEFVEKKNSVPEVDFDFYVHLMSLPSVFNTTLDTISQNIPYLKADDGLVKKFKHLFMTNNFKVGIVWAGNPFQENDKNRSTTFENFKKLKNIPGVMFFSLQKGEASWQLNDRDIINLEDKINDFADTAAIIENLDLIISVDTAVAHLAGAMGKPAWTLLSFVPDWRWMLSGDKCPWYPTMRLFRQKRKGDWNSVFSEVEKELRKISGR